MVSTLPEEAYCPASSFTVPDADGMMSKTNVTLPKSSAADVVTWTNGAPLPLLL